MVSFDFHVMEYLLFNGPGISGKVTIVAIINLKSGCFEGFNTIFDSVKQEDYQK